MSVDRVALVTGAARGIGAATVSLLASRGYAVVALDGCAGEGPDRPAGVDYPLAVRADLDAVVADHPDLVVPVVADVRDPVALRVAADDTVERFGRLDAAVAAAAVIAGGAPLWQTPDAQVDVLWDTDARGVWNTAAACVPHLLAGPDPSGARFVAVASSAGANGLFGLSAYSMVKHAVVGLVRGLAADLVGTGVTAVAVSPGSTRTDMLGATAALYGMAGPEELAAHALIDRLIEPGEIAATIGFCCSREGGVLNGSVVAADGGFPR